MPDRGPLDIESLIARPAVPDLEVHVLVVEDIYGRDASGSITFAPNGKRNLMTDGNGLISHNLAALIPSVQGGKRVGSGSGGAPLATQARMYLLLTTGANVLTTLLQARMYLLLTTGANVLTTYYRRQCTYYFTTGANVLTTLLHTAYYLLLTTYYLLPT
jgi:hypothetical protein